MEEPTPAHFLRSQARLAEIREDISTRLWPVNQGMSSTSFNDLMDQMALLQFGCERRIAESTLEGDRRLGQTNRRTLSQVLDPALAAGTPTDGHT